MNKIHLTARLWALIVLAVLAPVTVSAAPFAAYVIDARTGQPIYTQNSDTKLHPASLTKMMTLYLAFMAVERGQVRLDSKFTISSNAAAEPPSKLGVRAGQQIELRYLIRAAAIKSANDAATAIGEGLAGSEDAFARQMTQMARALGMNNTQFQNAHGLTQDGHFSTAHDMTILGRRLLYDFPQYYNLFSRRSADAGIATVSHTNKRFLDEYPGADGIKTGYTRAAGFNLTASAQHGSKRLIATVFGGTSTAQRNQVMAQLMDSSFSRIPSRVREVRPGPPPMLATQVVRRAKVEPTEATRSPQTQRLTLDSSPPPQQPQERMALLAPAQQPQPQANPQPIGQLALTTSNRPIIRPGGQQAAAVDEAVRTAAQSTKSNAASSASLAAPVLADSTRPVPAPRSRGAANSAGNASTAAIATAQAEPSEAAPSRAGPTPTASDADADSMALAESSPPEPRSDTVILAAMGEGDVSPSRAVEIVSRKSNSGRGYGVILGMHDSKEEADRILMQLALSQGASLSDAARRVADTKRGFQPSFANLTLADAKLTCELMQAKQQECNIVGP